MGIKSKIAAELVELVETNGLRQAQASSPLNIEKIQKVLGQSPGV
jgi:predicted XRE-type DNA-binding protein